MKKLIFGFILGSIITASTGAFANSNILAQFTNFNFLVDGESKIPQSQSLVVNGVSYLPVRDVANMLGFDVNYNGNTRTIELSDNRVSFENNSSNDEKFTETTLDGFLAVTNNNETYVEPKWYYHKLKSLSINNDLTFDPQTEAFTLLVNGKTIKLNKQNDYVKVINSRTFINLKLSEELHLQ